jgi:nucleoside phosphorylase
MGQSSSQAKMPQHNPYRHDSIDHYTIAWICALEEEYVASCKMLDIQLPPPEALSNGTGIGTDKSQYTFGQIAGHYLVIARLPLTRYGTSSASGVMRDMMRSFPRIQFALMVGIGGGAPSARHDIRLGDVVVSQPSGDFGGVVQHGLGRRSQDGRFTRTGHLNGPPAKVLGALPEIKRRHANLEMPDAIAKHVQRMSDMPAFQRPACDRLYRPDYTHLGDKKDCKRCDARFAVQRPQRNGQRLVHVHYGTIASGNTVLKDPIARDEYANDPQMNILCFEMEAAGLMNDLPCLVVRGICDYCDSHKNDDWHSYAALTAAAYARELLHVLRPQHVAGQTGLAK